MHNDECCTGQKWRFHAHTHANSSCAWFDHSHTRLKAACRAPFGRGSTIRQAKRRANQLGQTRELLAHAHHIGRRRQAGILSRQSLNHVQHTHSRHFYAERLQAPGSPRRGVANTPNELFTVLHAASPDWAGDFAVKRIPFGSCD